jgi:hypothetical protein
VRLVAWGEFIILFLREFIFLVKSIETGLGLGACICCLWSSFRVVWNLPLRGTWSQQKNRVGGLISGAYW